MRPNARAPTRSSVVCPQASKADPIRPVLLLRPSVFAIAWFSCEVRQVHAHDEVAAKEKGRFQAQNQVGIPPACPGAVRLKRSAWSAAEFLKRKCSRPG